MDFPAPPPSPVASARRSSTLNDDDLGHLLETSLGVPILICPTNKQQHGQKPPHKVDFPSLCVDHDVCRVVSCRIGFFSNHRVLPAGKSLDSNTVDHLARGSCTGFFQVPPAKRSSATRSPEKPCGFEECEMEGSELNEEFVWCRDNDFNLKMELICPTPYSDFS